MAPEDIISKIKEIFGHLDPWLVGGAARHICGFPINLDDPRDYDVVIPEYNSENFYKFMVEQSFEPADSGRSIGHSQLKVPSSPNGEKIKFIDKVELDIWTCKLEDYLSEVPTAHDGIAINLATNTHIYTKEFVYAMITGENFVITEREVVAINPNSKKYREHLKRQGISSPVRQ